MKTTAMLFSVLLMALTAVGCKQSSSQYSPEEAAHLKVCHEILEEYKGHWQPDENCTAEQLDSALLKADPDSLRAFFELFVDGKDECNPDSALTELFE